MTLYKVEIKGRPFYIIAESMDKADEKLQAFLKKEDWYCRSDRVIDEIHILAEDKSTTSLAGILIK